MSLITENPQPRRWGVLFMLLGAVLAVSVLGSWATLPKIPTWYASLVKPDFTPPSWLFGPVWTILYVAMAIAAWRVWTAPADSEARQWALTLFWVQLGLNALWSPVFFGLERPGYGLFVIIAMWIAIAATTAAFLRIDRLAGALMIPYLAWVTFAAGLNAAIVSLNV